MPEIPSRSSIDCGNWAAIARSVTAFEAWRRVPAPRRGRAWETLHTVLALDPDEHADVGPYVLTGSYTNLAYLRARGIRSFGVSPFAVNLLDAVTIHSKNERIHLPSYLEGVERTARIVREYALQP